ncbi:M15 family metallopeptidase [Actinoplanes sp. NPDC049548]|uniref:M15 family metallopeptidase n=1 Tax=Actinoplanes sp. NPDC049548 TaxID=3155152 RepID=UPI00341E0177
MTTRQDVRPAPQPFFRARRSGTATLAAVLAVALTVAGTPEPVSASVPKVAQKWSSLMYHSLTPSPAYLRIRKTLAAQRAALVTQSARVTKGRTAHAAAQAEFATAVTADAAARTRYAIARESLASARNRLAVVSQQRPRNGGAVAGAKVTVTAAAKSVTTSSVEARKAAVALKAAQAAARTATTYLDRTVVAWQRTSAAIRTNQQRLIALDRSAQYAAQAAALSREVVTEVRATFKVADTTSVNGITVHRSVAFSFRRMIADAQADGVALSGGGFRTKKQQIALRKSNGCPDVWTAPPSSCRVPTAIPGRSLHELGLAIDMTSGGRTLTSDSAGFRWLSEHADEYGFVNLPSEPWHWSITGG